MAAPACTTGVDPDVFFPDTQEQLEAAQAVCRRCALASDCLAQATAMRVSDGVWGGQLFERGRPIMVKRPPGRPRKDAAVVGAAA